MVKLDRIARGAVPLACMMSAVACTSMSGDGQDIDIRPVSLQSGANVPADGGYYQSAVNAIIKRDYGLALNFLQNARAADPANAAVLNAFGVVYDKLGRFDLSARYYAQARAADPQSTIVARNEAYSRVLQNLINGGTPTAGAAPTVVAESQAKNPPDVSPQSANAGLTPEAPRDVSRTASTEANAASLADRSARLEPLQPLPLHSVFDRPFLKVSVAAIAPGTDASADAPTAVPIAVALQPELTARALPRQIVRTDIGAVPASKVPLPFLTEEPVRLVTKRYDLAEVPVEARLPQVRAIAAPQSPDTRVVVARRDDSRLQAPARRVLDIPLPSVPDAQRARNTGVVTVTRETTTSAPKSEALATLAMPTMAGAPPPVKTVVRPRHMFAVASASVSKDAGSRTGASFLGLSWSFSHSAFFDLRKLASGTFSYVQSEYAAARALVPRLVAGTNAPQLRLSDGDDEITGGTKMRMARVSIRRPGEQ